MADPGLQWWKARALILVVILLASGCYPERRFGEDLVGVLCSCDLTCWGDGSGSACYASHNALGHTEYRTCTYNRDAARDCVKAWEERGCEPCPDDGFHWLDTEQCHDVYTDCASDEDSGSAWRSSEPDMGIRWPSTIASPPSTPASHAV